MSQSAENPASAADNRPERTAAVREVVFGPIRGEGLVQQAVRRLADGIRLGFLDEGVRLPRESELAERLGISAMTLREALAILRAAGWIETIRGKGGGTFVTGRGAAAKSTSPTAVELSAGFLHELTSIRRAISGEASALAAERAAPAEIRRIAQLAEAKPELPTKRYRQADASLHVTIAVASRSRRLATMEAELQVELDQMISAGARYFTDKESVLRASTREHRQLAQAIQDRDSRRAREITLTHVTGTLDLMLAIPPLADDRR